MAYFEELLQDFKEGAKLKLSDWEQGEYIWLEKLKRKSGKLKSDPSTKSLEFLKTVRTA